MADDDSLLKEALSRAEVAEKRVKTAVRSRESSHQFWLRAARKALDGDMRELRNRVELCEAVPVDVVLSSLSDANG